MENLIRDKKLYNVFKKVTGKYFNDFECAFKEYTIITKSENPAETKRLNLLKHKLAAQKREGKKLCAMFSTIALDRHCNIDEFNKSKFNPPITFSDSNIAQDELKRLIDEIVNCYNCVTQTMLGAGMLSPNDYKTINI